MLGVDPLLACYSTPIESPILSTSLVTLFLLALPFVEKRLANKEPFVALVATITLRWGNLDGIAGVFAACLAASLVDWNFLKPNA